MAERFILVLDEGTTSTRAQIFNHQGKRLADTQKPVQIFTPKEGWFEQDAEEIFNATMSTITNSFIVSGIKPDQIAGIGITNQRETTVVWDRHTGQPIYYAIMWQSRQTDSLADKYSKYETLIHQKTGLIIDSYFSATKVRWILDHVAGAQQRAANGDLLFGTIETWLLWKLTNGAVHITDYANASRTMMFNIQDLRWDPEILALFNIPIQMLPDVHSNSEIYASTDADLFFGAQVPISGMAGDQQAALFGQLALEPGTVKTTYGTGAFVIMNTGDQPTFSAHNLLTTIAFNLNGHIQYALEGSIYVAGSALTWLNQKMSLIDDDTNLTDYVKKATYDSDLYIVPAFTGLGAPYWDPEARGAVFGMTENTTKYDYAKATLQSLAYQTRDIINTMESDADIQSQTILVDGRASNNNFLMQFQADILGTDIQQAADLESKSLGAAYLAGLAVHYWRNVDDIKAQQQSGLRYSPSISPDKRDNLYGGWQEAVAATQMFKHRRLPSEE